MGECVRLADALAQIDSYDERLGRIEQEIERYMNAFEEVLARLETIPGVGRTTAQVMVAEVGWEVERFASAEQLWAWAGVAAGNKVSGSKVLSSKTRQAKRARKRPQARRAVVRLISSRKIIGSRRGGDASGR